MRKSIINGVLIALSLIMSGCSVASADNEEIIHSQVTLEKTLINDGYYLSDNDDSYIHIINGQIELCGYDFETVCRSDYDELTDEQKEKTSLESFVKDSVKWFEEETALQDFTPVKFSNGGEDGSDLTLLVLNYEFASSVGAYTGYVLNNDGTIWKVDNTYSYYGEALPKEFGINGNQTAEEAVTDESLTADSFITEEIQINQCETAE